MAERQSSADAFSVFLTRTAPADESRAGSAVTPEVLPRVGQVIDALSDGRTHTVSELHSTVSFGVLELAETIKLLQANGMVTVRSEESDGVVEELVELSDARLRRD